MEFIELKRVQAAMGGLSEQISILRSILEELEQLQRLGGMTFVQYPLMMVIKSRQELEEEIAIMCQMAECLEKIVQIYDKAEKRIVDVYDMEQISYPRTTFGISRISGLEDYEKLMPFN